MWEGDQMRPTPSGVTPVRVRCTSSRCNPRAQEILTESGQLQFASDQLLASRPGFSPAAGGKRSFGPMGKRFVMPVEEMVSAFWECPTGKRMAVSADGGEPTELRGVYVQ